METTASNTSPSTADKRSTTLAVVLAWLAVGLPLAWGVAQTLRKTLALFG
jgi:hypothetical protein